MQYMDAISKTTQSPQLIYKQFIQYHSNPSYASTTNAEELSVEQFYEDLQGLLELASIKRCTFHYRGLECKVGSQEICGVTSKFGLGVQNEARQELTEFFQVNTLVIACTLFQQQKMTQHVDITRSD